jgi:uncharacterized membrane protein
VQLPLATADWIAVAWFLAWWVGYVWFAERLGRARPTLVGRMGVYRRVWMARIGDRDQRIADVSILANLSNGSAFFASTTLLILGGLAALLGTTEKVASVVAELPFNRAGPEQLWDIKILLLVGIFTFALFKFTWSLRLYHFCSLIVGNAPLPDAPAAEHESFERRTGDLATLAAESFSNGLRAYYFALAALAWFLNPWVFMAVTSWVVLVL